MRLPLTTTLLGVVISASTLANAASSSPTPPPPPAPHELPAAVRRKLATSGGASNGSNSSGRCASSTIVFNNPSALSSNFRSEWCPASVANGVLSMPLTAQCGVTLIYNQPVTSGYVEIAARMAYGAGAVSSFVITDPASGDELDVEITGNAPLKVETMYFVNRQRVDMQAGLFSPGDVTNSYHRYGMEFTRDKVVWTIDGMAVRTLPNTGQRPFPNKLSQVKLGLWDGSATAGDWAGHADWSRGPMYMDVAWMQIVPYC